MVLTNTVRRAIRDVCINQVLGTDMKKHFEIVSRFQVSLQSAHALSVCNRSQLALCAGSQGSVEHRPKIASKLELEQSLKTVAVATAGYRLYHWEKFDASLHI